LPVGSVNKLAGQRCQHQRHHKGCAVYAKLERVSPECRFWSCRWLIEADTADMSRPDRSHYVIDIMPDYLTLRHNETGEATHHQVVQIWVDPKYPDAHRDPALRRFLERRAKDGVVGLVRWSNTEGMAIFPPELSENGEWNEARSALSEKNHSIADVIKALA
jgi:sarcosine oxidase delta subunit